MAIKTKSQWAAVVLMLAIVTFVLHWALAVPEPPDPDNDGLTTYEEQLLGTNPYDNDTDTTGTNGDGIDDGMEVALGRNPNGNDGPGAQLSLLVFTPLK